MPVHLTVILRGVGGMEKSPTFMYELIAQRHHEHTSLYLADNREQNTLGQAPI